MLKRSVACRTPKKDKPHGKYRVRVEQVQKDRKLLELPVTTSESRERLLFVDRFHPRMRTGRDGVIR